MGKAAAGWGEGAMGNYSGRDFSGHVKTPTSRERREKWAPGLGWVPPRLPRDISRLTIRIQNQVDSGRSILYIQSVLN